MEYVYEMPGEMLKETAQQGEVRRFTYDTQTYDKNGSRPLQKGAWVYLPFGYSADKQYNILYLLHGGGVNEDWWFKMFPDTVKILDNMIAGKICEPCIIAAPTYYRGEEEADRNAEYITEHFHHELRRDLIPAVESAFSTCAGGTIFGRRETITRHYFPVGLHPNRDRKQTKEDCNGRK